MSKNEGADLRSDPGGSCVRLCLGAASSLYMTAIVELVRGCGMNVKLMLTGEGRLRDDHARRPAAPLYVLGLGCGDILNVGLEKPQQIDHFASCVKQVPRRREPNPLVAASFVELYRPFGYSAKRGKNPAFRK